MSKNGNGRTKSEIAMKALHDSVKEAGTAARKTRKTMEMLKNITSGTTDSIKALSVSMLDSTNGLKNIETAASGVSLSLSSVGTVAAGIFPELEGITGSFGALSAKMKLYGGAGYNVMKGLTETFDAISSGSRDLTKENFKLGASFGGSLADAENFGEGLSSVFDKLKSSEFGSFAPVEIRKISKAMASANLGFDVQTDSIDVAGEKMSALSASTLLAGNSGLEVASYFESLSNSIREQGLTTQEGIEQLSRFREISSDTGLTVSQVSQTLGGLGSELSGLGLSASFGEPALKSFSNTVTSMGFGIEKAIGLSKGLTKSLAGITTNYSTAFITSQRGNLGYGGGALNAGIQMQARMLEAKKSGNEEDQKDLNIELMQGMKDTIASFGGGNIVTVSDAANDESLQTSYYTQKEQLKSMYGVSEGDANMTLEMMSKFDEAVSDGDTQTAGLLAEQIKEAKGGRNRTMGLIEKTNAIITGGFGTLIAQNLKVTNNLSENSWETISGVITSIRDGKDVSSELQNLLTKNNMNIDDNNEAEDDSEKSLLKKVLNGLDTLLDSMNLKKKEEIAPSPPGTVRQ